MAPPPPGASSPPETMKDQTDTELLMELQGDVDDRAKEEEGTAKLMIVSSKEWKAGEAGRVKQSIAIFTDYMKMIDRRKKRQTEAEKCKLLWAWTVLKNRYEKRQKQGDNGKKMTNVTAMVTTPPRSGLKKKPKSPTNPIEELRRTSQQLTPTEFQVELKQACLRRKKVNLERWFRSKMIQQHRTSFQAVLEEMRKQPKRKVKKTTDEQEQEQENTEAIPIRSGSSILGRLGRLGS
jgi:hypothetical protein